MLERISSRESYIFCCCLYLSSRIGVCERPVKSGMLPAARQTGRCIYCAFRARQHALQARRLSTHARHEGEVKSGKHGSKGPRIRYQQSDRGKNNKIPRNLGRLGSDSPIRKFFKGRINEQTPEERAYNFRDVLQKRLQALKDELKETPLVEQLGKEREAEGLRPRSFSQIWSEFERKMVETARGHVPFFGEDQESKPILQDLREAYRQRKERGLDGRIKYHFYGHLTGARFTKSDIRNQQMLADLRYPTEWYPATRAMQRSIHLHVGPTNSGKTYHALQRLEKAESGVYAGPLRLLAHEVYTRMKAKGKPCSLITGEERRPAEEGGDSLGNLQSCTVEMMPLNATVDVAVIDEIQMLGNRERGWAWTQALLGVKAREVHLCGEERTVPLVKELCASVGDKLEIHHYQRLSPLEMAEESLNGKLQNLRKGDCVVSFSVMGIHALRKQIERTTGKKVATVYGSLPPETRAQQARLFNDPNNDYDYLVASDAVGMGLNLAIKRIIFEASAKFDGITTRTLGVADIKQIAGRAGRYRTAAQATQESNQETLAKQDLAAAKGDEESSATPEEGAAQSSARVAVQTHAENTGFVTTLEKFDFPIVRKAMSSDPEPIRTAGLFPPSPILERFSSYFPAGTPFSYVLTRLHELSQTHSRFHLCGLKDQIWIADLIEPVKGLTVGDRNVICASPASTGDVELWKDLMPAFARIIAEQSGGNILDIPELPLELLETEADASRDYLRALERLHKGIVAYLWLSYRFAGVFGTRALAFHVKGIVEEKIDLVLSKFSFSEIERRKIAAKREMEVLRDMAAVEQEQDEENADEDGVREEVYGAEDEAAEEEQQLDEQTSLTSGGDHLSGEEDVALEDAAIEEEIAEEKASVSSFAEWRRQQTIGESQGSSETQPEAADDASLIGAALEGEADAREGHIEEVSEERPAVADVEPEAVGEESSPSEPAELSASSGLSDDPDSPPLTPESELSEQPLQTQEAAPEPNEARIPDEETEAQRPMSSPANQDQTGGVPPKHLAHLDVNVSELEREQGTRP